MGNYRVWRHDQCTSLSLSRDTATKLHGTGWPVTLSPTMVRTYGSTHAPISLLNSYREPRWLWSISALCWHVPRSPIVPNEPALPVHDPRFAPTAPSPLRHYMRCHARCMATRFKRHSARAKAGVPYQQHAHTHRILDRALGKLQPYLKSTKRLITLKSTANISVRTSKRYLDQLDSDTYALQALSN
jgi:hypothetical protein